MNNCLICMNNIKRKGVYSILFKPKICHECFIKMNRKIYKRKIEDVVVISFFPYNEFISSMIFTLKGCYDIALAPSFLSYDLFYLKIWFKDYYIVPVPSYIDHDKSRGFNHVEEIFKELQLPIIKLFKKQNDFKQSSLTAKERQKSVNNIIRINNDFLFDKKILLVDDIITTGSTIRRCIELLKELHPKSLKVVTIAYTTIESCRNFMMKKP